MIDAAEIAVQFVSKRSRRDLDADAMLLFALVRAVEVIGEAASRVTEETRAAAPQIPWPMIVSMRNRLIHAYFDINHDVLWKTATDELPELLPRLRAAIAVA
jgi:uncharacterized protein with HEPN domain